MQLGGGFVLANESKSMVLAIESKTGLIKYPDATIKQYQHVMVKDHRLITSDLKIVNGLLKFEHSQRISGMMHQITYQILEGYSSSEAFNYYKKLIIQTKSNIFYECKARSCGASNLWANRIFKVAKLYGPDKYQYYLAAKFIVADKEFYIAIYSIKRGNKKVYLHMEVIESNIDEVAENLVDQSVILDTLKKNKRWIMSGLKFNQNNKLEVNSAAVTVLAKVMENNTDIKIYLVGHVNSVLNMTTLELMEKSKAMAESVKVQLVNIADIEERIEVYGVGPLAPFNNDDLNHNGVEVILKSY